MRLPVRSGSPSLSPDGRWLAYVQADGGVPDIFVQEVGEGRVPKQLTRHPQADLNPVWSWDSRFLFFVRGWDTQPNRAVLACRLGDEPGEPFRIASAGDYDPSGGFSVGVNGDLFLGQRFQTSTIATMKMDPRTARPLGRPVADFPGSLVSPQVDAPTVVSSTRTTG